MTNLRGPQCWGTVDGEATHEEKEQRRLAATEVGRVDMSLTTCHIQDWKLSSRGYWMSDGLG